MKIKDGFVQKDVAGMHIVVPVNYQGDFDGFIKLNSTASFMFNLLLSEITKDELLQNLLSEYEIDEDSAKKDIDTFLQKLADADLLETE